MRRPRNQVLDVGAELMAPPAAAALLGAGAASWYRHRIDRRLRDSAAPASPRRVGEPLARARRAATVSRDIVVFRVVMADRGSSQGPGVSLEPWFWYGEAEEGVRQCGAGGV